MVVDVKINTPEVGIRDEGRNGTGYYGRKGRSDDRSDGRGIERIHGRRKRDRPR